MGACVVPIHRTVGKLRPALVLPSSADRYPVPPAIGAGWHDLHRFDDGFYCLITNMRLFDGAAGQIIGESLIEFHYRLSNRLTLEGDWGEVAVDQSEFLLWYQPEGCDDVYETISAEAQDLSVSIYCTLEWLLNNAPEVAHIPYLRDIIEQDGRELVHRRLPVHPAAPPILSELIAAKMDSGLGLLKARARALELLCTSLEALLQSSGQEPARRHLSQQDLHNIDEARDILHADYANPPSLPKLARKVGLNAAKLTFGFRQRFAMSLNDFIRVRRLEEARRLLSTTDLQVGQVATAVGYRHHSTFTAAFTQHFGVPPKAVVRGRYQYGKAGVATPDLEDPIPHSQAVA